MKKKIVSFFMILLLIGALGFSVLAVNDVFSIFDDPIVDEADFADDNTVAQKEDNLIDEQESQKSSVVEQETTAEKEKVDEILSAEDLAVKAEIAKHSNTKIVFRKEQKQNLFNKVYSLSFERVDDSSENRFKRVMYKTENGDKFGYNIDTGRLVEYFAVVKTVSDNITVSCADTRKIVEDFLSGEHEISEYLCEETVSGGRYYFQFYKEYQNYKTSDMISVSTDKNGNILSFNESEKSFDELNVLIDREEIIEKIKPLYEKYTVEDISLDYDEDGDLVALVKISYETEAGSSFGAVQIIKIE